MEDKIKENMLRTDLEGLAPIIERWTRIGEGAGEISDVDFQIFPYMVWHDKASYKHNELLAKLAEFFAEKNALTFSGDVKYIQLRLPYHQYYQSEDVLNNTTGLIAEISKTSITEVERPEVKTSVRIPSTPLKGIGGSEAGLPAGEDSSEVKDWLKRETEGKTTELKATYTGIIYFDVTEWIDDFSNAAFTAFLQYVERNSDSWYVVYSVVGESAYAVRNLVQYISFYQRAEFVDLLAYSKERMCAYAAQLLGRYDVNAADEAKKELNESIGELFDCGYIIDYKSVEMFLQDVIYNWLEKKSQGVKNMSLDDVSDFKRDGKYVQSRVAEAKRRRIILE